LCCRSGGLECKNTPLAEGTILLIFDDFWGSIDVDLNDKSSSSKSGTLELGDLWCVHKLPRFNGSLSEDWKDSSSMKGSLRKQQVCSESSEQ